MLIYLLFHVFNFNIVHCLASDLALIRNGKNPRIISMAAVGVVVLAPVILIKTVVCKLLNWLATYSNSVHGIATIAMLYIHDIYFSFNPCDLPTAFLTLIEYHKHFI
uniref:Putative secreted protein n=1 Tax=Corethrella appendiculata TaxID=1370023 RepID=U5ELF3_9DIPT